MEKEINMNDMNQIADYAAHIIKEHFPESDAQRMIIQHLGIFSRFENNMCAISLAMGNIRNLAQKSLYQDKEQEEHIEALKNIEVIADSLHNVGGFLIAGVDCDAMHLYRHGRKENWPTGIPNNTEYISLKFFPNHSSSCEEYREFILTPNEMERFLRKSMSCKPAILPYFENRKSSIDGVQSQISKENSCSSSINIGIKADDNE